MEQFIADVRAVAEDVLAHLGASAGAPTATLFLAAVAAAAVITVLLPRPANSMVTVAHEGGHALAAVLTGRRAVRVRVHADGSGLTYHRGTPGSVGHTITAFAGYPFPGVLGAALLAASVSGSARLWGAVAGLGLILLLLRTGNLHGWFAVGAMTVGLGLALWLLPAAMFALVLAAVGALLLLGSLRSLLDERRMRRAGQQGSDVAGLGQRSVLPAGVWWLIMLAVILGGAWLSGQYVWSSLGP